MWAPIAFEKSFRMGYSRTRYGTGYYIYHQFAPGTKLSQPVKAWDGKTPPDKDVLELLRGHAPFEAGPQVKEPAIGLVDVPANGAVTVAELRDGPGRITTLGFSLIDNEFAAAFGDVRLRITWDGRKEPSVDAPIALFFGAGTLYNRDPARSVLVRAFPMYVTAGPVTEVQCSFPMPFFRSAKIELVGAGVAIPGRIACGLLYEPFRDPPNHVGYFHATYKDHGPNPEFGKDLVLLDTRETEAGGDWSGSFVGTSWIFSHNANLNTLEGDPRFYFDDSNSPQAYGTGTEEW